ncbi:MAG: hypothetical protein ACT6T3_21920, partial [Agrobacterium sp.]
MVMGVVVVATGLLLLIAAAAAAAALVPSGNGCRVGAAVQATSFVSPKRVPQLADSAQVMSLISRRPGVIYPVLTPNMQGFESAVQVSHCGWPTTAFVTLNPCP